MAFLAIQIKVVIKKLRTVVRSAPELEGET
jgi:hypothetical protein